MSTQQQFDEAQARSARAMIAISVLSVAVIVLYFLALGGNQLALVCTLIVLFLVLVCLSEFAEYDAKAHEFYLQLSHIHRVGCDASDLVLVIEKVTHSERGVVTSTWFGGGSVTITDSEITQCRACASKTRFDRGQEPVLVKPCCVCDGWGEVPDVGAWSTPYDTRKCWHCKGSGQEPKQEEAQE